MTDSQTTAVEIDTALLERLRERRLGVKETSAKAILERAGGKRMSPEEFDRHFGHLPTDGEG
jgi:hypothetical protein